VDDRCLKLLATQTPLAGDLRLITAAMKINADLERIGDQAVNIAESVLVLIPQPPLKPLIDNVTITGEILVKGLDVNAASTDVIEVRRRVGMVFQKSNPFPKSIYENVVYGLRIAGINDKATLDEACERSLKGAALWDEVKDRLGESGLGLSGGQMQRVCIARAIAVEPEIILMDEPCSALDPIATLKIEELMYQLKEKYTIVIVTHNLQQAARVSDKTAFFWLGRLVEFGPTAEMFTAPKDKLTEDYITGRFG